MDDKELYERRRFHELINDVHINTGKIELINSKAIDLKEDIDEIKDELNKIRKSISDLSKDVTSINTSVIDLKKFFWLLVAITISAVGSEIMAML
jgi:uncharacterized protein YoxC